MNASKIEKNKIQNELYDSIVERSAPIQRKRLERNFESRNSAWLTVRISDRDNFCLSKSKFNDAIAMRYDMPLKALHRSVMDVDRLSTYHTRSPARRED